VAVSRDREPKEGECPNTILRITLAPGVPDQAGLQTATAALTPIAETIRANAETQFPPTKYSRVAPRVPGVVREVRAVLGQSVEAGETLAVLEAPDLGAAKSDYLLAKSTLALRQQVYDSEKTLFDKKIGTGRELLTAQTSLDEAKLGLERAAQRLSALGLTDEQVKSVAEKRDTAARMELPAPFAGVVTAATAVPGETAGPDKPIFTVAVPDRMWLAIDLNETDLTKIARDQRVVFTTEALPGQRFAGKVVAVGGEVDDRTRTVRVFADVKNVQGVLRANMFGRAEITVKPAEPRLVVPKDAVQNDGDCMIVFVSPAPNVYQARKVETGAVWEGGYEIVGGLAAGEKVVTTGSFLLKTEILRGQIGAG
jgi:cobalt-zinc-cadmium efflux system membrane fusion protein